MSDTVQLRTLWAYSDRYRTVGFVAAFTESEVECCREWYEQRRQEAKEWWRSNVDDHDGPVTFFETWETMRRPAPDERGQDG